MPSTAPLVDRIQWLIRTRRTRDLISEMLESTTSSITHLPSVPMARFGKLDESWGGGNRYRVIWAPSRKIIATKPEGTFTCSVYGPGPPSALESLDCGRPVFTDGLKPWECWVLEQWRAPWDCTDKTPEQWNRDPLMLMQGPYPSKGDYFLVQPWGAFAVPPPESLIERVILMTEDSWKRHSQAENHVALDRAIEKDDKAKDARIEDRIRNRLLASAETVVSSRHARGTKTIVDKYTTRDVGLATTPGAAMTVDPRKVRRGINKQLATAKEFKFSVKV